jgi:hypothetical protein
MSSHTVIAILRDPDTGDAVVHHAEYPYEAEFCEFYWAEGNMACDCNRKKLIDRAGALPEMSTSCGNRIILEAIYFDGVKLV